jgi:hypothetical protein
MTTETGTYIDRTKMCERQQWGTRIKKQDERGNKRESMNEVKVQKESDRERNTAREPAVRVEISLRVADDPDGRVTTPRRSIRSSWYQCVADFSQQKSQISAANPLRLKSKSHYDQSTSMSWCQAPVWVPRPILFFSKASLDSCEFAYVGRPLLDEVESVLYNCFWASPAQSISGSSHAVLMATF